ncbi:MAG TPA: ribonuclease Y [Candidatus Goldiibacteriota bacterium]|nr:ribonuclease Y [Candidatus Goldiibacteriota bacterium]HPN64575.1 ribonuclease Y [Candidatus Goldiibacteriota bacterium]HRQ44139.1 ribonuclease Y [Candidatus Goldiibacteriota bacterium]
MEYLIVAILALIVGVAAGFFGRKIFAEGQITSAKKYAAQIIEGAQKEAGSIKKEAELESKDTILKAQADFDAKTRETKAEIANVEKKVRQREENLDKKMEIIDKKEKDLSTKEKSLNDLEKKLSTRDQELDTVIADQRKKLENISGLSAESAKQELIRSMMDAAKQESLLMLKRLEEETKETAEKKARDIVSIAVQRIAADHTSEISVSVVPLPSDDMKGRIIGREGRNIKTLETATGVDFIIDDTPEAVTISAFDPVRREIAKLALQKLIQDGRIHPGRIEEVVEKTKLEMDQRLKEIGEQAAMDVGIPNIHPEIIKLLGKLHYRTSYGQNVLKHSVEMAYITSILASELGIDPTLSRRAALLHDIGKAIDHEIQGSHVALGVEAAKKYGESEAVLHAIEAHHNDVEPKTIEAVLVQAADGISAARPGARRETLENYVKRLENLEKIASAFEGVQKTYAIQAGREIRIMVESDKIDDNKSFMLSKDIAKKIEEELEYPGQIKVTVIREVRAVEYAK